MTHRGPLDPAHLPAGLSTRQRRIKRAFDLACAVPGLIVLSPLLSAAIVAATISTRQFGLFAQERIGQYGETFKVYKIRSMRDSRHITTTVTASGDPRITPFGRRLRATKIDELPNLLNVVLGHMSLVGPRPDVPGWADQLQGPDRVVLTLKPGITGPASLAFRDEEELLAAADDPEAYNRDIIWPEKVRLNKQYVQNWNVRGDLAFIFRTVGVGGLGWQSDTVDGE